MLKQAVIILYSTCCIFFTGIAFAKKDNPTLIHVKPSIPSAQSAPTINSPATSFPISFSDTDIFTVISSPIASIAPQTRAEIIQKNITRFAESESDPLSLKTISFPEGLGIGDDNSVLMIVSPKDAAESEKTSAILALEVLSRIQTAVKTYRTKHAWKTHSLGAVLTLISIIGLWQALRFNNHVFKWITSKVSTMHHHWKRGIHFKGYEVLSSRRIERVILFSLKSLRVFVILLCWYFFLPLILSFFPETRKIGVKIFDYLITPFTSIFHTIVNYIPNLFYIFVIIVIAFYVLKVIAYAFKLIEHGELKFDWFYDDWAHPTYQIVRFLVIVTALISAYPYIPGSSSEAFQGVGLVLGALISFASSSAISNIVAGVILTYTRAFRLNDRVKVGDTVGDVVEKTLLVTRIKTIKHVVVTIPNSLVMGAQIINYSTSAADANGGVILHTSITIGYDVPWKKVQALLIDAALSTELILKAPAPFVLKTSLDDWYVSYEINAYTKDPAQMAVVYSNLHQNILDQFNTAGLEIMSPHYYAMRDGNASTVPSVLSTPDYSAPAFKVQS